VSFLCTCAKKIYKILNCDESQITENILIDHFILMIPGTLEHR